MITTRTWAIAGVSAALILVPAGASYAVTTASDNVVPTAIERLQLRLDHQATYGDQTQDRDRDQVREQLRDTENCDGDGPFGDGPQAGDGAGRGGMMGGWGSGR